MLIEDRTLLEVLEEGAERVEKLSKCFKDATDSGLFGREVEFTSCRCVCSAGRDGRQARHFVCFFALVPLVVLCFGLDSVTRAAEAVLPLDLLFRCVPCVSDSVFCDIGRGVLTTGCLEGRRRSRHAGARGGRWHAAGPLFCFFTVEDMCSPLDVLCVCLFYLCCGMCYESGCSGGRRRSVHAGARAGGGWQIPHFYMLRRWKRFFFPLDVLRV